MKAILLMDNSLSRSIRNKHVGLLLLFSVLLQLAAFQDDTSMILNPECALKAVSDEISSSTNHNMKVAIILRGDAYRNWNGQYVNASCCRTTRKAQMLVAESHLRLADHLFDAYNMETHFFIATFACTNGKKYVESHLPFLYRDKLKDIVVLNRSETSTLYKGGWQWDLRFGSAGRGVALLRDYISRTGAHYDHIFSTRLDYYFSVQNYSACAFPRQVFESRRPVSTRELVARGRDELLYLPSRFFECWWHQLNHPVGNFRFQEVFRRSMFGTTVEKIDTMNPELPTYNLSGFSMFKLTPQTLAAKTKIKDPSVGLDCLCGKWLLTLDAANKRPLHMDLESGEIREYTARGSSLTHCPALSVG